MPYVRKPIKAPIVSGRSLKALAWLVERPLLGAPLRQKLLRDAGIFHLRTVEVDAESSLMPRMHLDREGAAGEAVSPNALADAGAATPSPAGPEAGFRFRTVTDFADAYRSGAASPVDIAAKLTAAVSASNSGSKPLRAVIAHRADDLLAQARASEARLSAGKALSVLDGVPVVVKDEVDMVPYPTTVGTRFLGTRPATSDATTVARLREAGALLVGKANMHELGIGVTGHNPHHGVCRNPYNPAHHTGGSSSGSGASVGSGLVPLALGADGGGSIRIPSAFCGVVGLKATFGRVSEHGAAPLCWSVAHIGPHGATARDAAIGYAVMAGADPADRGTLDQPAPSLQDLANTDLTGLTIGLHRPWFEDARPDVVSRCNDVLRGFERAGAQVREIELEYIEAIRLAHLVTIASEMVAGQMVNDRAHRRDYGLDVRLNFALARESTAMDPRGDLPRERGSSPRWTSPTRSACGRRATPSSCGRSGR